MAPFKHMRGEEFLRKMLEGERDFRGLLLEKRFNLSAHEGYPELQEFLRNQVFQGDPILLENAEALGLVAVGIHWPYLSAVGTNFSDAIFGTDDPDDDSPRANFYDTDFSGCNLYQVRFNKANLEDADLTGARLYLTIFDYATLRNTNFEGVTSAEGISTLGAEIMEAKNIENLVDNVNITKNTVLDGKNIPASVVQTATLYTVRGLRPDSTPPGPPPQNNLVLSPEPLFTLPPEPFVPEVLTPHTPRDPADAASVYDYKKNGDRRMNGGDRRRSDSDRRENPTEDLEVKKGSGWFMKMFVAGALLAGGAYLADQKGLIDLEDLKKRALEITRSAELPEGLRPQRGSPLEKALRKIPSLHPSSDAGDQRKKSLEYCIAHKDLFKSPEILDEINDLVDVYRENPEYRDLIPKTATIRYDLADGAVTNIKVETDMHPDIAEALENAARSVDVSGAKGKGSVLCSYDL